jgi:hypothetical protein
MRTSPVPTDRDLFQQYTSLVTKLTQLSEKRVQLIQLSSSLNSGLGDLAIRIVNADSHPLVQSLREEAHSAALERYSYKAVSRYGRPGTGGSKQTW